MNRWLPLALVVSCTHFACGGAAPPPATPSTSAPASDGERCLAIAAQTREPKPNEPAKITAKHILVK
ncbi:MAG: hypothetical protein U0235_00200 [Polyangiaceae bacterium]